MIVSTLLAAGLAAGTPVLTPVAAMNCHPDPQKSVACKRATEETRAGLRKTAAARKCHPQPDKALACIGRQPAPTSDADALATRETTATYD
ncbi:hypothetical protein RXV95_08825 [Novosphingobium sp. ZN18A2]|uniref:hypothetical protein n=1 Tax=Novosphingobium sp. ZN18A2 TaxID=3079861 RepID=UPI0030CD8992